MEHLKSIAAWCIPPVEDRAQHTPFSIFYGLLLPAPALWLTTYLLLAYPTWRAPRLALLPFTVALCLRSGFFARFDPNNNQHWNQALGFYGTLYAAKALWWSLETKQYSLRKGFETKWPKSLLLVYDGRCQGWDFAPVYPISTTSRSSYLKARVRDAVVSHLIIDLIDTISKDARFNPALLHDGGLVDATSGLFGSAAVPILTFMTGVTGCMAILNAHTLLSFFSVLLFPSTQVSWSPPLFAAPFTADSLRSFWSYRWHQMLRPTFIALGYSPVSRVARKLGLPRVLHDILATLSVFAVSAFIHEAGMESMRRGKGEGFGSHGYASARFFMLQGFGCILEGLWNRTGYKVSGLGGRIRFWTFLVTSAMPMIDSHFRHGLIKSIASTHQTRPLVDLLANLLQRSFAPRALA